ncbi:hypothetical protein KDA_39700 [Dictyobacter alpinus]|uniref:Histidine kinase domain-containing protein n=1 Tax=Dictyobacter alpinus TaxID=2014873 RepID=A0A402BB00_9CHLR|nr:sensor histidine kinase [Dictyobacter alpinus]GCE28486.1 hypothetical protein KDA_39700 [Dictyobacter alpinus]
MLKQVLPRLQPGAHLHLRWRYYALDSLFSLAAIALITAILVPTNLYHTIPTVSLLYLLAVLLLAGKRGLYAASLATVLSLLTLDFFFFAPSYNLAVVQLADIVTLIVFMLAAILTSKLAAELRLRAEEAQQRESELRHLYEQAQELASLQERQHLARELHDSVSQVLYGISLGAHTAQEDLDTDPAQARSSLDYVIGLTEAGLAEMRALIFELRPESLATEGLVAALSKQVAVLRSRHRLQVDFCAEAEPELSLENKQNLYRIAQEALHNIVKHARASQVTLTLEQHTGALHLQIRDDGHGFNPEQPFPGHLGVLSMRERVKKMAGTLHIDSHPRQGTTIDIQLPVN